MNRTFRKGVRRTWGEGAFRFVTMLLLGLISLCILYPLYFVVLASFTKPEVVNSGRLLLIPEEIYLGGYRRALRYAPLWRGFLNTIVYTGLGTFASLAVTMTSAYALSRKDLAGRRAFMLLFAFTMFFGGGMVPLYLQIRALGLYNTLWAMILPGLISVSNLIVCRTFLQTNIPDELYEAALIDNCDDFTFFFHIILPLSSSILGVLTIFYATGKWNSFFDAIMYLGDQSRMPLQCVLRDILLLGQTNDMMTDALSSMDRINWAEQLKYCVIVISAAPLLVAYPFVQKQFVKGVMIGSLKG